MRLMSQEGPPTQTTHPHTDHTPSHTHTPTQTTHPNTHTDHTPQHTHPHRTQTTHTNTDHTPQHLPQGFQFIGQVILHHLVELFYVGVPDKLQSLYLLHVSVRKDTHTCEPLPRGSLLSSE